MGGLWMSAEPSGGAVLSVAEVEEVLRRLEGPAIKRALLLGERLAAGLPVWSGEDLLQEAETRLLEGTRTFPADVPPVVVVMNVMRSIAANERRSVAASPVDRGIRVAHNEEDGDNLQPWVVATDSLTPEQVAQERQVVSEVERTVADNQELSLLVMAWAEGMRGEEAADLVGVDLNAYEALRKRLVRSLRPIHMERNSP